MHYIPAAVQEQLLISSEVLWTSQVMVVGFDRLLELSIRFAPPPPPCPPARVQLGWAPLLIYTSGAQPL